MAMTLHQPISTTAASPIFTVAELQSAQAYFDRQAKHHDVWAKRNPSARRRAATYRDLSMLALIAEDSGSYDDQQELHDAMKAFGCDSIWKATQGVAA